MFKKVWLASRFQLFKKKKKQFTRAGGVAQLVTHLLSMLKSLDFIPSAGEKAFTTKFFRAPHG